MVTSSSSGKNFFLEAESSRSPWELMESGAMYWDDFTPIQKEKLVQHHAPQIRFLALRMKAKLPKNIELGELISAGTLGLMESLKKYKPELGIRFETYSENRIRGAMLDELRRLDWFPRGLRQRVRQLDNVIWQLEQEKGCQPSVEEIQERTGLSEKEVNQGLEALQSQLAIPLDSIEDTLAGESNKEGEPFYGTAVRELTERIAGLIELLTDREKLVLSLYYAEELNMREVAEVLGITEGRVSQLHAQALTRLRREFFSRFGDESPM